MDSESIVSIHASSREDATTSSALYDRGRCFNPRVLAGGRDKPFHKIHKITGFQSTRPRGRTRRRSACSDTPAHGFNPRVLAGGRDSSLIVHDRPSVVSIHASSREDATIELGLMTKPPVVSIHASSREDATALSPVLDLVPGFNPRVLAGGRDSCWYDVLCD